MTRASFASPTCPHAVLPQDKTGSVRAHARTHLNPLRQKQLFAIGYVSRIGTTADFITFDTDAARELSLHLLHQAVDEIRKASGHSGHRGGTVAEARAARRRNFWKPFQESEPALCQGERSEKSLPAQRAQNVYQGIGQRSSLSARLDFDGGIRRMPQPTSSETALTNSFPFRWMPGLFVYPARGKKCLAHEKSTPVRACVCFAPHLCMLPYSAEFSCFK